jgi:hypothetical protein
MSLDPEGKELEFLDTRVHACTLHIPRKHQGGKRVKQDHKCREFFLPVFFLLNTYKFFGVSLELVNLWFHPWVRDAPLAPASLFCKGTLTNSLGYLWS